MKLKSNCCFIHIGKCGGTHIVELFGLQEYHLSRPRRVLMRPSKQFVIWLRHPIRRFISAFNYSHALANTDVSSINSDSLTLSNSLAPARLKLKIDKGFTVSPRFDWLVSQFESANHLAESLTSPNRLVQSNANELMQSPHEHIHKGIGWYLHNGKFINRHAKQILFVGKVESMTQDIISLATLLNVEMPNTAKEKTRVNRNSYPLNLSAKGLRNIQRYYQSSDYAAIDALYEHNLITREDVEQYRYFEL